MLLIYATLFWAGNFTFGKALVEYVPPVTLSLMRWSLSFAVFFPFAWKELKANHRVLRTEWKTLLLLSFTGLATFNSLTYVSVQYTSSINAALMNSFTPVLVAILSFIFLQDRLRYQQWIGILISFAGVTWIITDGNIRHLLTLHFNKGDLIMSVAILSWAIYSLTMKKYGSRLPQKAAFLVTIGIAIVILFPFATWETLVRESWSIPTLHWLSVIYVGVFPSVISFICWNKAVIDVGPSKASTYLHLIVVFASLFGVLFLGEKIVMSQIMGGLFVITGVYLVSMQKMKPLSLNETKRQ